MVKPGENNGGSIEEYAEDQPAAVSPEESEDSSLGGAGFDVMRSRINQGEAEDIPPVPGLPHIADSDQS